jgi:hypothetical protein
VQIIFLLEPNPVRRTKNLIWGGVVERQFAENNVIRYSVPHRNENAKSVDNMFVFSMLSHCMAEVHPALFFTLLARLAGLIIVGTLTFI